MIPKLSFIPQALDKWFEKGDNYISVEEIRLKQNIGIFRNTASHFFARSTEKRGANPRRRNGTVRCMFFPTAQQRGHSGETGEGFAERTGESPRTKSGYSVPISALGFPKGAVCKCIKTFAPRFEKTLVLFYCRNRRERTLPFFTE